MNRDPVRVDRIHWSRVFPILHVLQAAPLGCSVSALVVSCALIGVSWVGSVGIYLAFATPQSPPAEQSSSLRGFPWMQPSALRYESIFEGDANSMPCLPALTPGPLSTLNSAVIRIFIPQATSSQWSGLRQEQENSGWLQSLGLLFWNAVMIGVFGAAVARITATRFCRQIRTGPLDAALSGFRHIGAVATSIAVTLLISAVFRGGLWVAEIVASAGSAGGLLVSVVWPVVILTATCLLLALGVLGFAWLLSLAAIAVDGCSGTDALSRSISYVFSHRLLALACVVLFGALSLAVRFAGYIILALASVVVPEPLRNGESDSVRRLWEFMLFIIPDAAQLSVIIAGATITYVLLRQKEDGVRIDAMNEASV